MKSINTLIKINMRDLDELRKNMVVLQEEREQLITNNNTMEEQLQKEHILAAKDPEMGVAFNNYRKFIRAEQTKIVKSLVTIEEKIETIKDNISVKFTEVKKYEIILQNKLLAIEKAEKAQETKELDEIAINHHLQENTETRT